MSWTAEARVATANASKYVGQVCRHWAHDLEVKHQGEVGRITFPGNARGADWPGDAVVTLTATPEALLCRIEATAEGQLEGLKGAVARHVDRFAFHEAPLAYDWRPAGAAG